MTDFLDHLERDLVDAARRRQQARSATPAKARRWRPGLRGFALAAALLVPAAGTAAGGTLYILRGDPIPAPRDAPADQQPRAGTSRVAGFAVADPNARQPKWTLRLATSRTGLVCSTSGQRVGGQFGLVGEDDRFRVLPIGAVDSCSTPRSNASSLIGARALSATRTSGPRTILFGVGGSTLRGVEAVAGGRRLSVGAHPGGTFLLPLAGLPEDLGLRVTLRFADGHRETHAFGSAPMVAPDPAGGHAWRLSSAVTSNDKRTCVSFAPARAAPNAPTAPSACGVPTGSARNPTGVFFASRRILPGSGRPPYNPFDGLGRWGDHPPRTAVWGFAGRDVASISATGPLGQPSTRTFYRPNGSFLVMFGPKVPARAVTVTVRFKDGRRLVRNGDTNLVTHRVPRSRP